MILEWIDQAETAGARLAPACRSVGLDVRTIQRWRVHGVDDMRHGPKTVPPNKLREVDRRRVLEVANSPAYRDKSPQQIVPDLADHGVYIAVGNHLRTRFSDHLPTWTCWSSSAP